MPRLPVGEPPGQSHHFSRLILGTDHLGKVPLAQTHAVLAEAVRLGINAFDTAPIYAGDIELKLGRWLRATGRDDLHVITKGGFPHDIGPGNYRSRLAGGVPTITAEVLEEARASRQRLGRPIALYLMHRDDGDFDSHHPIPRPQSPASDIVQALNDPRLRANFGLLGVSNWRTERVAEARAARRPGSLAPVANSPYFSLLEMGKTTIHTGGVQVTHAQMMDPHFQPGVKLMTYSPLGGFSIVRPGWAEAEAQARRLERTGDRYWGRLREAIFHPTNAARFRRAEAFTQRFNAKHHTHHSLDQVLHAYVLAHPRTDFVVIGPRTVAQLRRTVASLELAKALTPADLDELHGGLPAP